VLGIGEDEFATRPFQLVTGRSWTGCLFGGWKGRDDVPKLVASYMEGGIPLEEFITHKCTLEDINSTIEMMHRGEG
jgi:S-(hydroxymethyl)glutathione dehydrogenase / alcohol dehydrogenase